MEPWRAVRAWREGAGAAAGEEGRLGVKGSRAWSGQARRRARREGAAAAEEERRGGHGHGRGGEGG